MDAEYDVGQDAERVEIPAEEVEGVGLWEPQVK